MVRVRTTGSTKMKMIKILTLFLFLVSCGTDSASNGENSETEAKEKSVVTSSPDIESIALDAKSDLPECGDDNRSQLAYVVSEDNFYVCQKEWKLVAIKGKQGDKGEKGEDGEDGITTTVHVDGGNSSNVWIDTLTGFSWYLGGTNTHAQALIACSGDYRLPTINEAYAAITHGIRLIAGDIGANPDFWTSEAVVGVPANRYYATVSNGNPVGGSGAPASTSSVFCVK